MGSHTKPQHRSQPAQEPDLPCTRQTSFGATQTHIVDDHGERVCTQHLKLRWVCSASITSLVFYYELIVSQFRAAVKA
jgi:hypothetical protein